MPLMVAEMARLSSGESGSPLAAAVRLRRISSTWMRRHGVDVGVAQADGALEDRVGLEQRSLLRDREDHAVGEVELGFEGGEDAIAERFVFDERGVEAGDAEVGLGERHLDVADDVEEEGEVASHGLELGEIAAVGVRLHEVR